MRLRSVLVLSAVAAIAVWGCRLIIGSLDECANDGDCAGRNVNANLVCRNRLCVQSGLDARCSTLGPPAGAGFTMGLLLPLSNGDGGKGQWGPYWQNAVELAINELNPPVRTGVRGGALRAVVCDTAGDPIAASALASSLIDQGITVIVSDGSPETIAVAARTVPAGVLLVSGAATSPELTNLPATNPQGLRLLWRTTPSDALQANVIAAQIAHPADAGAEAGALPKVGAFERDDAYGQGLYGAFHDAYRGPNQAFLFPPKGDVTAALAGVGGYSPAIALVIGYPDEVVNILNGANGAPQFRGVGWFFTQGAKSPDLFAKLANASEIEGARGTSPAPADPSSPAYAWFAPQYAQKYGDDPSTIVDLANMFDAAMLVAIAAQAASGTGGAHLVAQLMRVSAPDGKIVPLDPPHFGEALGELAAGRDINIEGASGHLDFDNASGEAPGNIEVWQVVDGGFHTVSVISP
jgi:branched-chain amino acid transport system substrate-binding protein